MAIRMPPMVHEDRQPSGAEDERSAPRRSVRPNSVSIRTAADQNGALCVGWSCRFALGHAILRSPWTHREVLTGGICRVRTPGRRTRDHADGTDAHRVNAYARLLDIAVQKLPLNQTSAPQHRPERLRRFSVFHTLAYLTAVLLARGIGGLMSLAWIASRRRRNHDADSHMDQRVDWRRLRPCLMLRSRVALRASARFVRRRPNTMLHSK